MKDQLQFNARVENPCKPGTRIGAMIHISGHGSHAYVVRYFGSGNCRLLFFPASSLFRPFTVYGTISSFSPDVRRLLELASTLDDVYMLSARLLGCGYDSGIDFDSVRVEKRRCE